MPTQTVFAYVLGTDLEKVAGVLEQRFDAMNNEQKWNLGDVWVVNQRLPESVPDKPTPAVEWDLGFNLTLPSGSARPANWIDDVVAIATTFAVLHRETGRQFVIGIHDQKTDRTEDLFRIDTDRPDLDKLKAELTRATAKATKK